MRLSSVERWDLIIESEVDGGKYVDPIKSEDEPRDKIGKTCSTLS